ncbi:MAG: DNA-deoxyinosine glycosylase [Chloroflexia bacterium]|nr:DNA-deoxyinosine glycosylase [Chloroflexia bacterium]
MPGTPHLHSFAPISTATAERFILGTMPSTASLAAGQYDAHPRNLFWRLMADMLGFAPEASYDERRLALQSARIAVWDVVQCCTRASSLDADIVRPASERLRACGCASAATARATARWDRNALTSATPRSR